MIFLSFFSVLLDLNKLLSSSFNVSLPFMWPAYLHYHTQKYPTWFHVYKSTIIKDDPKRNTDYGVLDQSKLYSCFILLRNYSHWTLWNESKKPLLLQCQAIKNAFYVMEKSFYLNQVNNHMAETGIWQKCFIQYPLLSLNFRFVDKYKNDIKMRMLYMFLPTLYKTYIMKFPLHLGNRFENDYARF
jgi:hypothetical protein